MENNGNFQETFFHTLTSRSAFAVGGVDAVISWPDCQPLSLSFVCIPLSSQAIVRWPIIDKTLSGWMRWEMEKSGGKTHRMREKKEYQQKIKRKLILEKGESLC